MKTLSTNRNRGARAQAAMMMLAGCLSAGVAYTASATANDTIPRIVVHYDQRSLESEKGVQTLYRKLVAAANEVCPAGISSFSFASAAVRSCRTQSLARAVSQIDNQRLAQIHASRSGTG